MLALRRRPPGDEPLGQPAGERHQQQQRQPQQQFLSNHAHVLVCLDVNPDARLRGVSGFYFFALWFVEDLLGQRGQGGINDLLRAMSSTGSRDEGFRSVYGRDFAGLQRQAQERLRQRHGS